MFGLYGLYCPCIFTRVDHFRYQLLPEKRPGQGRQRRDLPRIKEVRHLYHVRVVAAPRWSQAVAGAPWRVHKFVSGSAKAAPKALVT
jgi:hypothetical protein